MRPQPRGEGSQAAMENAYKRKKQPEQVRRALLDEAMRIAVGQGLGALTVQAVAQAAGVTKGGFLHHFPSKQDLIDTMFAELLGVIDAEIDARIAADPEPCGAFTRAYVDLVFETGVGADQNQWAAFSMAMLTDSSLRPLWRDWFCARLERHHATDSGPELQIARLAADGVWVADLAGVEVPERARLKARLMGDASPKRGRRASRSQP